MSSDRPGLGKCVLIVDDDDDVRDVVCALFEELGFEIVGASGGATMREAIRDLEAFDLIFLDVNMPGEPSATLALHALEKGLRVIMCSGNPVTMEEFADHVHQLLHKPFALEKLRTAVMHALASDVKGQRTEDPA